MAVLIPATYVSDLGLRLSLYRRLGELGSAQEVEGFAAELIDRFGDMPPETQNLLEVIKLKIEAKAAGVHKVEVGPKGALISFWENTFAKPEALMAWVKKNEGLITIRGDQRLFYRRAFDDEASKVARHCARFNNTKEVGTIAPSP